MEEPTLQTPVLSDGIDSRAPFEETLDGFLSEIEPLSFKNEFELIQGLIKSIKFVLDFPEDVLAGQKLFWLRLIPIRVDLARERIKMALEKHCHTSIQFLAYDAIEIDIHPDHRVYHNQSRTDTDLGM